MLDNMDIVDCLIFLETEGFTSEQIQEKMGCNRSTLSDWWKKNKSSPRYLQKMRKWCQEFIPVEQMFVGVRPPKDMFLEALDMACETDNSMYTQIRFKMGWKTYYEKGIPAAKGHRTIQNHPYKRWYHQDRPPTELVREIIAEFHPNKRIREAFQKEGSAPTD